MRAIMIACAGLFLAAALLPARRAAACRPDAQEPCMCDDRAPFMRDPVSDAAAARVKDRSLASLTQLLGSDPDADVRQAAALEIAHLNEAAVPALARAAADPSCKVAVAALTGLGGSTSPL